MDPSSASTARSCVSRRRCAVACSRYRDGSPARHAVGLCTCRPSGSGDRVRGHAQRTLRHPRDRMTDPALRPASAGLDRRASLPDLHLQVGQPRQQAMPRHHPAAVSAPRSAATPSLARQAGRRIRTVDSGSAPTAPRLPATASRPRHRQIPLTADANRPDTSGGHTSPAWTAAPGTGRRG